MIILKHLSRIFNVKFKHLYSLIIIFIVLNISYLSAIEKTWEIEFDAGEGYTYSAFDIFPYKDKFVIPLVKYDVDNQTNVEQNYFIIEKENGNILDSYTGSFILTLVMKRFYEDGNFYFARRTFAESKENPNYSPFELIKLDEEFQTESIDIIPDWDVERQNMVASVTNKNSIAIADIKRNPDKDSVPEIYFWEFDLNMNLLNNRITTLTNTLGDYINNLNLLTVKNDYFIIEKNIRSFSIPITKGNRFIKINFDGELEKELRFLYDFSNPRIINIRSDYIATESGELFLWERRSVWSEDENSVLQRKVFLHKYDKDFNHVWTSDEAILAENPHALSINIHHLEDNSVLVLFDHQFGNFWYHYAIRYDESGNIVYHDMFHESLARANWKVYDMNLYTSYTTSVTTIPRRVVAQFEIPKIQVSVEDIEIRNEIKLFPNPSNSEFQIESNKAFTRIDIFDALGNLLVSSSDVNTNRINTAELSSGTYFLRLHDTNGKVYNEKIVIEK